MASSEKRSAIDYPIYLCAPVNALVEGIYEENVSLAEIKAHGDFGLGTFNDLDGEMVMIDGRTYQITADGTCPRDRRRPRRSAPSPASPSTSRSATMTFLTEMSHERFSNWLDGLLPSPNLFYAIRIEGEFSLHQSTIRAQAGELPPTGRGGTGPIGLRVHQLSGTMAGFYTPAYMASLNVPGMHLHFLSEDKQVGGHVLECAPLRGGSAFSSSAGWNYPCP